MKGLHRRWLLGRPGGVLSARRELRGRRLGCWCADGLACHVDTLVLLANCSDERLWEEVAAAGAAEAWQAWVTERGSAAVPARLAAQMRAAGRAVTGEGGAQRRLTSV